MERPQDQRKSKKGEVDRYRDGREELDEDFEQAAQAAVEEGADSFESGGTAYVCTTSAGKTDIYAQGDVKAAQIFTSYTVDTFETGLKVADDFRPNALLALASGEESFQAGGETYTIKEADGELIVNDSEGNEYAEFGLFSIRR